MRAYVRRALYLVILVNCQCKYISTVLRLPYYCVFRKDVYKAEVLDLGNLMKWLQNTNRGNWKVCHSKEKLLENQ